MTLCGQTNPLIAFNLLWEKAYCFSKKNGDYPEPEPGRTLERQEKDRFNWLHWIEKITFLWFFFKMEFQCNGFLSRKFKTKKSLFCDFFEFLNFFEKNHCTGTSFSIQSINWIWSFGARGPYPGVGQNFFSPGTLGLA